MQCPTPTTVAGGVGRGLMIWLLTALDQNGARARRQTPGGMLAAQPD